KIFVDFVNTKSCSKCAELNFVSQPAVSQKIKQIESEFKTPLFIRNKKSVKLTPAGKILYDESQKIVGQYQSLLQKIKSLSGVVQGTLKIASIYSVGLYRLNEDVKNFIKKYPAVHLDMELSHSSKVYESILNETADLGFVAYPRQHPCVDVIPYKEEEMVLVTHPDNPLGKFKKIDIGKINDHDFVGFEPGVPTGDAIRNMLKSRHVNVKIKMEFDSIEIIKRATEIGEGVSILPKKAVEREVEHGLLNSVAFAKEKLLRPIAIVIKKNRIPSIAAQKFIEEVTPN
ncbi:MAG: LysR family transcriptional regulator, partial [Candidatus Margulisiibacteriota bacterium]